jgi:Protein of unknown function (DUF1570)
MKRLPLALALLLGGAASTASADYVLIVANLGRPGRQQPAPAIPGMPAPGVGAPGQAGPSLGGARFGGPATSTTAPGATAVAAPTAEPFDPDKVPMMILAVIEVEKKLGPLDMVRLARGLPTQTLVPFKIAGFDGKIFLANTSITSVAILHPNNKPTPPLHTVYEAKVKEMAESKTAVTAEQWADLAEWCLGHGMLDHFKQHMEKAAEVDKNLPRAAGYLQMKATLAKPVDAVDTVGPWRKQLLSTRYETKKSAHYALLSDDPPAAEERIRRLEEALESYYYWFALHGAQLPVPTQHLAAVLTKDPKTFKHLSTVLDSTPVICDSFYARRENIAVFSSRRLDDAYDRLEKMASPLWTQGFSRDLLLKGKGFPTRGVPPREVYDAMTLALLLKVMELDGEVAGTQHGATRQLMYASGFLPPAVVPPEWVQFGMGAFFETSPGSPWPTLGLPNFAYGPLFKDLVSAKKLPSDPIELLKAVVTDDFFRNPAAGLKKDAALRRARATAWSLVHFLVRKRSDGLRNYFKELSQMPRDVALDENQLWRAFARAFGAVDATGEPDPKPLRELADDWDKDMRIDQYDTREIDLMRAIRLTYQAAAMSQTGPAPGTGQPGGLPQGAPPAGQFNPTRRGTPGN